MPAILYYKKNSEISHSDISESSLRFLANLFFFISLIYFIKEIRLNEIKKCSTNVVPN